MYSKVLSMNSCREVGVDEKSKNQDLSKWEGKYESRYSYENPTFELWSFIAETPWLKEGEGGFLCGVCTISIPLQLQFDFWQNTVRNCASGGRLPRRPRQAGLYPSSPIISTIKIGFIWGWSQQKVCGESSGEIKNKRGIIFIQTLSSFSAKVTAM